MPSIPAVSRLVHLSLAVALALTAGRASAFEIELFDETFRLDNLISIGASWRMQDRDNSLIGKSSLYRLQNPGSTAGLCYARQNDDGINAPQRDSSSTGAGGNIQLVPGVIGAGCGTANAAANQAYVNRPGSMAPNGDAGNLNFDKGDIVHAVAKLTSDLNFSLWDFNFFVRGVYFFDENYTGFEETRPDTTFQDRTADLPKVVENIVGSDLDLLDVNVSRVFTLFDRDFSVKIGRQALNWGESSLLVLNSLNTINPPDGRRLNMPGLDLKEIFIPVGMAVLNADVIDNVGLELFYQYEWEPVIPDPVGSFFSQSDSLGGGGRYAMLSFGKVPDDPEGLFRALDTCTGPNACFDSAGLLGSTSSRTIYRNKQLERERLPDDGGQYGVALRMFLPDFNNGTELNLYHANYHSRLPVASFVAAQATCIGSAADLSPVGACAVTPASGTAAGNEPLPVNTAQIVIEYPENIHLYGVSFNTTIGDYALSGEYAYRDNLPTQIHSTDLTLMALQPAFPTNNITVGSVTIPGRRAAAPDFTSQFRDPGCGNNCVQPGEFIDGYERLKTGQLNLTLLRLIGGDNPIGASQMTLLFETGMNRVFDMPGLTQLQFQGGGVDTHISSGGDGTIGINPIDVRTDPADPSTNSSAPTTRQNPTAHKDHDGFGSSESYGYRLISLNRYDSAFLGANLETLVIVRHDVKGTTPGIGTNFVEGRKQFNLGLRFDYLNAWNGEIRYTWFTGGKLRDGVRDRDNVFFTVGYQF